MVFEHRSYRTFLKELLAQRQRNNSAYSLRAMAAHLGFSGSQLSEALSGKANFSVLSLKKIAKKLGLSSKETDYLCLLGQLENEGDPEGRAELMAKLQKLRPFKRPMTDLTVDQYKQIADWHHSAILELVYIEGFEISPDSVSKKLGISKIEAELAIERLVRLELLEVNDEHVYQRQHSALQIRSEEKNAAMRKFYRQMFEKASVALDEQTPNERWSGYETLPLAREAMPEIREACDAFFNQILEIANKHPVKKDVYHLMVHFFNLTPEGTEK